MKLPSLTRSLGHKLILAAALLISSPAFAEEKVAPAPAPASAETAELEITGHWKAEGDMPLEIKILEDGKCEMILGEQGTTGTYELDLTGDNAQITWTLESQKTPTLSLVKPGENGKLVITKPQPEKAGSFEDPTTLTFGKVEGATEPPAPAPAPVDEANKLVGSWKSAKPPLTAVFTADGKVTVSEGSSEKASGTFTADYSKTPHEIDMDIPAIDKDTLKAIFKFNENGTLTMTEPEEDRANDFSEDSDAVTFTRAE